MMQLETKNYEILLYDDADEVVGRDSFVLLTPENLEKELDKADKQGYLNNDEEIIKKSFNKPNYIPKSSLCATKICFVNKYIEKFQKYLNDNKIDQKHIISNIFADFTTRMTNIDTDPTILDNVCYTIFFPKQLYSSALSLSFSGKTLPNIIFNNGISELHNVKNFKIKFGNLTLPVTGILDAKLEPDLVVTSDYVLYCSTATQLDKDGLAISYICYKKDDNDCENPIIIDMNFVPENGSWYNDLKSFDKYSYDISNLYNIENDYNKAKPIELCLKNIQIETLNKPQFKTSFIDILVELGFKDYLSCLTTVEVDGAFTASFPVKPHYMLGPLLGALTNKE